MKFGMRCRAVLVGLTVGLSATAAPVIEESGNPVTAVWKERRVEFFYRGRTSRYSCDGLRDKLRAMLLDAGVRRDLQINPFGCWSTGSRLSLVFSAPALPDVAMKPAHPGDLAATGARFVPFRISNDTFRNMGMDDCELVQEFTRQILPKLTGRAMVEDIHCVPNPTTSHFLVRGEILKSIAQTGQALGTHP